MKAIFSEYAKRELEDAMAYLDIEFEGLGDQFKSNVQVAVKRIIKFPFAWSIERREVRKCLLHKFPYKLLYSIEDDHIFIIAVAHQHRKPDYWVNRQ